MKSQKQIGVGETISFYNRRYLCQPLFFGWFFLLFLFNFFIIVT